MTNDHEEETSVVSLFTERFSNALRKRIGKITDPLGGEVAIWKWVRDPINEPDVREIAARYLLEYMRSRKRAETRLEEDRARREADQRSIAELEAARQEIRELTPEELQARREARMRILEQARESSIREAALARKELESRVTEWKSQQSDPRVEGLTLEQGELAMLGFPLDYMNIGQARIDENKSIITTNFPGYREWANTWGTKARKKEAIEAVLSADGRELEDGISFAIRRFEGELKVKWTDELLAREFNVDGVSVTWASASVEQHQRRHDWLKDHAIGTLETAAMHARAINDIRDAKATSLGEIN